jgi:hypothetical protein
MAGITTSPQFLESPETAKDHELLSCAVASSAQPNRMHSHLAAMKNDLILLPSSDLAWPTAILFMQ